MVVGSRKETAQEAYRPGHRFGNRLLTGCVASIFGNRFGDMLSGYRVFSRRFVKSFPALSAGFAHRGSERQAIYQLPDECKLFSGASGEVTLE
jgi:hypothetical protein